jgi:transcription antitermination factor NusG
MSKKHEVKEMTEAEANEMGIVELFQRVVLQNEKIEDVPESA